MTKEELIKNQFPNDEFLQSGVLQIVDKCVAKLEKENAELKTKYSHNCPNCAAFGKHCPHKVNGDPYFYDCYLTVVELEEENAKLKEINGRTLGQLNLSNGELIIENEKLKKENAELKAKNK